MALAPVCPLPSHTLQGSWSVWPGLQMLCTSSSWDAAAQIFPWTWDSIGRPNPCSWVNMKPLPDVWRPHWGFTIVLQPSFDFGLLNVHFIYYHIDLCSSQVSALSLGLSDEPLRFENQWLTEWMNVIIASLNCHCTINHSRSGFRKPCFCRSDGIWWSIAKPDYVGSGGDTNLYVFFTFHLGVKMLSRLFGFLFLF